jgi:cytosine/adenosine deaminase-related metal-dependent hydrolase
MKENNILLKGGCVVTMDAQNQIFEKADILIQGDTIAAIARDIEAEDCQLIDAGEMIVMPGFIDTHRHVWESVLKGTAGDLSLMQYLQNILGAAATFSAEDVYLSNLLGALESLDAGITTLFDWSHIMNSPAHADAAITALQDAGIRAVFGYGTPGTSVWDWFYESKLTHPLDIERICKQFFSSDRQLVTPALAIRGPEYSTLEVSANDIALARGLGLQISMHVGCGSFAGKYRAVAQLADAALLGPDMNFAHGNFLSDADFRMLADNGCSVSITPEVEMQMGLGFPATGKAMAAGMAPSLGVDVVTGAGGDMFTQMRIALQTERALQNNVVLESGQMPQTIIPAMADALRFATINGAKALRMDRKTGSIEAGKQADIILLKTDALNLSPVNNPVAAIVSQAGTANIDTVFVAGNMVKQHGRMLFGDIEKIKGQARQCAQRLFEQNPALQQEVTAA